MNKIFRRVFNAARGAIVAVEETKASHSQANAKNTGLVGGGYKPLVFAVVSAVSAAGVNAAVTDEPVWGMQEQVAVVKVNVNADQQVDIGEFKQYETLFVGDDSAGTRISFTNAGIVSVRGGPGALSVGNNDVFTNIGSPEPHKLGGVVDAQTLTLTSGSYFNNSGRVVIKGTATVEAGATFQNTYNGKAGTFSAGGLVSAADVTNAGSFTISGDSQIAGGYFINNGEATFSGLTTIADGAVVYNKEGTMTLSSVAGSASTDDAAAQIYNAIGKTMTFKPDADIGAKVANSGDLILEAGAVISDTVTNTNSGTITSNVNLIVRGKLDNTGIFNAGNVTVQNGEVTNNYVVYDIEDEEGNIVGVNEHIGTFTADALVMSEGSSFVNAGDVILESASLDNSKFDNADGVADFGASLKLKNGSELMNSGVAKTTWLNTADSRIDNQYGNLTVNVWDAWRTTLDNRHQGTVTVKTQFNLYDGEIKNQGKFVAEGGTSLKVGASLINDRDMVLNTVVAYRDSLLQNTSGSKLTTQDMQLAGATLDNTGDLTAGKVTVQNGGEVTNKYVVYDIEDEEGNIVGVNEHIGTFTADALDMSGGSSFVNAGDVVLKSASLDNSKFDNADGVADFGASLQLVNDSKLVNSGIAKTESLDTAGSSIDNQYGNLTVNVWDASHTTLDNRHQGTVIVKTQFNLNDGEIKNQGKFVAEGGTSLKEGASLINDRDMTLSAIIFANNSQLQNTAGSELTLTGDISAEQGVDIATIQNAGNMTVGVPGVEVSIDGVRINNYKEGKLHAVDDVALGSEIWNWGDAQFDGKLILKEGSRYVNQGTTHGENFVLDLESGSTLTNSGTITGTAASYSFNNVTYEEVGAAAELDVGDIAFNNSTIKLTDGAVWNKSGSSLGEGNDYVLSSNFAKEDFGSTLLRDWRDGFSILEADEVNGINSFVLNEGGLLVADKLGNFSGTGYDGKITFNGGALETGLDQVFENVAYVDGITGSVITDSSVVGDLIAANTIGDVTENAQNAFVVGEEGGHIVFNDNYISTDLVAAVSNAFKTQEGWDNLTAHYTGELDPAIVTNVNWANSLTNQIDSSVVLGKVSLIADQPRADDGMFDMVDGKLVMNAANAQGTTELGVGNIVNTENVVIENGAHLTLVGFGQGESMVGDNGTVTVDGSDSLLTLGWNAGKLTGIVAENGGRVEITNGSYTVGSITGDGSVLNQGYLEAGNLQAQQFVNVGGAYVTGNVNVGNFANNAGLVVVDGTLTATEGLSNDAGAELAVDALEGFELRNNGSVLVAGDATIDGELSNGLLEGADGAAVQIDGDLTAALVRNAAVLQVVETANVDKIENEAGSIQLGSLISNEVINKGTLIVKKDQGLSEIREALSNAEKASILVYHDLKAGTIDNDGVLRVDGTLTAETLDNASGANVVAGNADVDGIENFGNLGVEGYIKADTLSNHGAMSARSLEVSANFTNAGTAGVVEDASVAGKLTNTSEGDLIVGGKLSAAEIDNDGTLMARSLDVTKYTNAGDAGVGGDATVGTLMNTGDLTVSGNATVNGVGDNKKTMIVAQKLTTNDVFFNHAGAELTVGGDADFNDVFANQGTAVINGVATVAQGVNAGEATLAVNGDLTVGESLDNQNVLTVFGALGVGGNLDNSGKTFVDGALTVDGTLTQTAGEFLAIGGESGNVVRGAVDVKGGKFTLGETTTTAGAVMTATNGSTVQMVAADDKLAGRINVDGATFTLGSDLPETLSNVDEPQHEVSSLFNMNQQTVDLGADGIIAVGDGAENVELTGGSVWFGSGSLLALNTSTYNGDSGFFKGQGSFKVEDGAQIQVSDASIGWGTYTLVSEGFGDVELAEGGWLEHENIIYTGEKDVDLTIRENEDGNVEITVGSNNILDKLPDVAIPNLVNEVISDPHRSPNDSGVKGFLAGAIENGILSESLQAETINNTAQIMASGGVLVQGMTLVGNVMDITDRHLSYEDVHFKNGQLQRFDGVRLWADALGQRVDASGYDFSGSSAEFDGYNSGFIFGADLMASCDARYGAAFAYQNANIDSNGSVVKTSNEADAYTFALYGAKTYGNFNFIGSFAYTRIDSDLEQSLPGALGAKQGKHKMDVTNDIFTLGLKGEYKVSLSQNTQMVPYVGVRAVWMDTSDETSKLGGSDAFDYETDSVTQVQFPIGVAFQGTTETKSGWIGRGVFDISVTPVAGDKDSDTTITANGLTAQDVVNTEFSDDLTGAVRIGISAEKDDMSFGGNLGFSTGGSRDGNVTFGLNARYRF